ncbi:MAG: hypothetical protein KJO26_05415 [Deltaproteobacteria bacterium]|nr:hypothetical protein [Deltaproteobacteria bacterium]NNK85146.1 hypothetical protein [Desulfobacterales bacterium]
MTLKKYISLAGMLLLLPVLDGCLVAHTPDNRFGIVNSGVLSGRIFMHIRVPYAKHLRNVPSLSLWGIDNYDSLNAFLKGDIFTNVGPYKTELHNTPLTDSQSHGMIIHIEEPISGYGLYTELNTNAIGDIAKKHGLSKVYFADIEIFNVLGIWRHEKLHIYGE